MSLNTAPTIPIPATKQAEPEGASIFFSGKQQTRGHFSGPGSSLCVQCCGVEGGGDMGKGVGPFPPSWPSLALVGSPDGPIPCLLQFLVSSTTDGLQMEFGLLAILNTDVWNFQCKHLGCLGRYSGVMDGT